MNTRHEIRGTFRASLRGSPIWKVIGPVFTASSESLQEACGSQIHDFTFHQETDTQTLQVLLLTPSSLEPQQKQSTVLRLRQFAASDPSSCPRKAIAFLLSEEGFRSASEKYSLNGLLALQAILFESLANPLPVIPIADAPSLFSSIQEYMANLEVIPATSASLGDPISLLSHATSGYPGTLCEQTTNILSDLIPSFRALSQATRTQEGHALLADYLGLETAAGIVRFWEEDVLRE